MFLPNAASLGWLIHTVVLSLVILRLLWVVLVYIFVDLNISPAHEEGMDWDTLGPPGTTCLHTFRTVP